MAKDDFQAAVSTISGSSFPNFLDTFRKHPIDPEYRTNYYKALVVSLLGEPFRSAEQVMYGNKIARTEVGEDPIFVLGHWRSGTTYLHNLLTQAPGSYYVDTYQSVFPHQVLSAQWLYKTMMRLKMPKKRAADGVPLSADNPQEEEFAIGNITSHSYYHFWHFPKDTRQIYEDELLLDGLQGKERDKWKKDYTTLVKKARLNIGGNRFISKNPPHTGRIPILLEMFPNAKFIYIVRNPITVFRSTVNFFTATIKPLQFQNIDEQQLKENILYIYDQMMHRYEATKSLIPEGNLVEVRYEDFEQEPYEHVKMIYDQLQISGWDKAEPLFKDYIASQQKFKSSKHSISQADLDAVMQHWGFAMEKYGYTMPEGMTVK